MGKVKRLGANQSKNVSAPCVGSAKLQAMLFRNPNAAPPSRASHTNPWRADQFFAV
jgi:hypothetical protein